MFNHEAKPNPFQLFLWWEPMTLNVLTLGYFPMSQAVKVTCLDRTVSTCVQAWGSSSKGHGNSISQEANRHIVGHSHRHCNGFSCFFFWVVHQLDRIKISWQMAQCLSLSIWWMLESRTKYGKLWNTGKVLVKSGNKYWDKSKTELFIYFLLYLFWASWFN